MLHKFTVDLPKKHGRGGQSALRFARLRMEKRHNYVRKARALGRLRRCLSWRALLGCRAGEQPRRAPVRASALNPPGPGVAQVAETAVTIFISGDRPNVAGLVLAGSADFKTELSQSDMFDQRLQAAILAVVDVSYGAAPRRPRTRCVPCSELSGARGRLGRSVLLEHAPRVILVRWLQCSALWLSGCG